MTMFQNLRRVMRAADTLKVRCENCGHMRTWSLEEAFRIYGGDASPHNIREKSCCSGCGARKCCVVWI
jgi:hypothetical protein